VHPDPIAHYRTIADLYAGGLCSCGCLVVLGMVGGIAALARTNPGLMVRAFIAAEVLLLLLGALAMLAEYWSGLVDRGGVVAESGVPGAKDVLQMATTVMSVSLGAAAAMLALGDPNLARPFLLAIPMCLVACTVLAFFAFLAAYFRGSDRTVPGLNLVFGSLIVLLIPFGLIVVEIAVRVWRR
jgi:hypothetical protein